MILFCWLLTLKRHSVWVHLFYLRNLFKFWELRIDFKLTSFGWLECGILCTQVVKMRWKLMCIIIVMIMYLQEQILFGGNSLNEERNNLFILFPSIYDFILVSLMLSLALKINIKKWLCICTSMKKGTDMYFWTAAHSSAISIGIK